MTDYRIVVKDLQGNIIGEFDHYSNLRYRKVLNAEGDCSFDIDIFDEKANSTFIAPGVREVYIYRDGQVAWGGIMWNYSGKALSVDNTVTIQCMGFLRWLKKACIYTKLTSTGDAAQIAWDIINAYQGLTNGNRGITEGSLPTTFTLTEDMEYTTVYDEIAKLSKISPGFDYEVTQTKVFNIYSPSRGSDKTSTIIYNLEKNISVLSYTCDFDNIANEELVQGAGYGDGMATAISDDIGLQASYGLLQKINPSKTESDISILQNIGNKDIAANGLPRQQFDITANPSSEPDFSQIDLGDLVLITGSFGNLVNLYNAVRISAIEVSFDNGIELVKPTFQYGSI